MVVVVGDVVVKATEQWEEEERVHKQEAATVVVAGKVTEKAA